MKKTLFFVAELYKVIKRTPRCDGSSEIQTELVKRGLFVLNGKKYVDTDTYIGYGTDIGVDTSYFIKIGSIIPLTDYLKQYQINVDDKISSVKVKALLKQTPLNKRK